MHPKKSSHFSFAGITCGQLMKLPLLVFVILTSGKYLGLPKREILRSSA